jgi:CheY-like chemotaxis protein
VSRRILLCVDDEPDALAVRRLLLESQGYTVLTAQSGEEALSLLGQDKAIDLVLLDYVMRGMNGDELAEKLRQQFPRLPLIAVSAVGQLPNRLLKNVDGAFQKGQDPEVLLSLVADTLRRTDSPSVSGTVLCVDDEEQELDARKKLFESAGFHVLEARSADSAMEAFRTHRIDAVVLDYWLSGNRKGTALAQEMKRLFSKIPIVILSGFGSLPGEGVIVDSWISKGGDPERLVNEVKRLIANREPRESEHS